MRLVTLVPMSVEEKNESLAKEIKDFLVKNDLVMDIRIYFNNKAYDSCGNHATKTGFRLMENIKSTSYFVYGNDETVSMSFEGEFYHVINTCGYSNLKEQFDAIFLKHDCFYQLGNAWNLSVYYNQHSF